MMNRSSKQHLSGVFPLLLFAVLAACVLTVLMTGAGLYRRLTGRDSDAQVLRTAGQYIAVKVRQTETPDAVSVGDFGGENALIIAQELEGETYLTRVYCYDGWLRELFSADESGMSPEDGEKLLEMDSLAFTEEDGLLTVGLTDGENSRTLLLHLREGESP